MNSRMNIQKILIGTTLSVILGGVTFAYTPFTFSEHQQIDRVLQEPYSQAEQKEKSDFFSRLAQKCLAIRKTFDPQIRTKLYGAKFTAKDQAFITSRVKALQALSSSQRDEALADLLKTQQLAEEISRSLQIASQKDFQGYAKTKLPTPLFWLPKDEVDLNFLLGGKGTTGMKLNSNRHLQELAVVLPPKVPLMLMRKIQT